MTELELPVDFQAEPVPKPDIQSSPKTPSPAVIKARQKKAEQKEKMAELIAQVASLQAQLDAVAEQPIAQEQAEASSEPANLHDNAEIISAPANLQNKLDTEPVDVQDEPNIASEQVESQSELEATPEQASNMPAAPVAANAKVKRIIEALLFAAEQPMTVKQLHAVFPELEAPDKKQIQVAIDALCYDYRQQAISLHQVANGYRFQVKVDMAPWVARLFAEKPPRYSRALLETIAIIAYQQPVTRGDIEEIRGVSVSSHMIRTLLEREWVKVLAHKEVPGRPALYGTTKEFLDYFNLPSLDAMPPLEELQALALEGELEI